MADFSLKSSVKSALRELASPIADIAAFGSLIQTIITDNPWGCTAYEVSGETLPAVAKSKEAYSGKFLYQDANLKTLGNITVKAPTSAGFTACITKINGKTTYNTAMGAAGHAHDSNDDAFSCTLRGHHSNGEIYNVAFSRDKVVLSGFEDSAIQTVVETWADTVTALA